MIETTTAPIITTSSTRPIQFLSEPTCPIDNWLFPGIAGGIFVVLFIIGIVLVALERAGKRRKDAHQLMMKMRRKCEETGIQTQTQGDDRSVATSPATGPSNAKSNVA